MSTVSFTRGRKRHKKKTRRKKGGDEKYKELWQNCMNNYKLKKLEEQYITRNIKAQDFIDSRLMLTFSEILREMEIAPPENIKELEEKYKNVVTKQATERGSAATAIGLVIQRFVDEETKKSKGGGGRKKKRKTKRKKKKRKKRKKMHNSRTNQTRKIRGGGANDEWGNPITKRWYNMKITKQDHPTIFRIAALAHAGFSWEEIQRLLDGYHPDTNEKHYTFQLVNLDTVSFNSLLSGGNLALAIREGNDAYNKHMADLQSHEPSRWHGAVDEYKKRLFREEQRLKRKRSDALAKSGKAVGDTTAERRENAIIHERNEHAGRIQQKIAKNRGEYTKAELDDKVYCINCGHPFHKGCIKAFRDIKEERNGEITIKHNDKCPMCRQDLFKIKELQMSEEWFINAKRWTPAVKREPVKKKEDEEGCPICLLSWDECDLNVGKWGDDIIVEREPRLQRWLMRWRQRARDARQRLRNTRCAVMGGKRNKKKKRKQKTRKKKGKGKRV